VRIKNVGPRLDERLCHHHHTSVRDIVSRTFTNREERSGQGYQFWSLDVLEGAPAAMENVLGVNREGAQR
jgi:hypothetical protein